MRTTRLRIIPILAAMAGAAVVAAAPAGPAGAAMTAQSAPAAIAGRAVYRTVSGRLYHVAASSPGNVWAVGLQPTSSLIMHWNGSSWAVSFNQRVGFFTGVATTSAHDAWAVGGTNWFSPTQTLAEHWNGTSWTQVPTPNPSGGGYFNAVAATSTRNAWAVGLIGSSGPGGGGFTVPLIEHWNGRTWQQQRFRLPINSGEFTSVAATGPDNAWAVGTTSNGSQNGTLIEHWNGMRWKRLPGNTRGLLQGVTATGPDNAWAVGFIVENGVAKSLTDHWTGKRWTVVPSPNPTGDTNLWAVSAASRTDVWAVGYTNASSCGRGPTCGTAAFRWNGRRWAVMPSPDPPAAYLNAFLGVITISRYDAWAVGTTDFASTLIAHWNGKAWNS